MKKFLTSIIVCLLVTTVAAFSEGLLPQLGEVYGVGMPSMGDVLSKYPNSIESLSDGSTIERFSEVTEEDYTAFGNYLAENGCEMLDYSVEGAVFKATIGKDGKTFSFEYDFAQGEVVLTYPESTFDARVDEAETLYKEARQAISEGNYDVAYSTLTSIVDYTQYKDVGKIILENPELLNLRWKNSLTPGNTILMGLFEQDNDETNGPEPIEWLVLGADNKKVLLLSKYCLIKKEYSQDSDVYSFDGIQRSDFSKIGWECSSLKEWLNDQFSKSFTDEEIKMMINDDSCGKIFLLSEKEVTSYLSGAEQRMAQTTPYCDRDHNPYEIESWWLRDFSCFDTEYKLCNASVVDCSSGFVLTNGAPLYSHTKHCVRPAIWITGDTPPTKVWLEAQIDILMAEEDEGIANDSFSAKLNER